VSQRVSLLVFCIFFSFLSFSFFFFPLKLNWANR
jgi:hypothetical protein